MTGGLFSPLPLAASSPVRAVAPGYSVDSFSEYATRTVSRDSAALGLGDSLSTPRAPQEDEELFRDLFAGDNDTASTGGRRHPAVGSSLLPQKPVSRRIPSTTVTPRTHPAPMWTAPPHPPTLSTLVPRLNLEELLLTRPDDEDLEQMKEEDGQHDPRDPPSTSQLAESDLLHARGFNSSLGYARANNNEALDTETLRFLEKLDLKVVLHTPRPDLLSFYPSMPATPVKMSVCSPSSKAVGNNALEDVHLVRSKAAPFNSTNEKNSAVPKALSKETRADGVASRLAYMETTYGTMPCAPRKTRRGTIDRLANPISGHSSTLQALSPEQRKKREMAALSGRAPLKLIAAAVSAGSGRRSVSVNPRSRRGKSSSLFDELGKSADVYEMVARSPIPSKRKLSKRRDPLIQRRRAAPSANNQTEGQSSTQRKSKATGISCSLTARKEVLKKKLQSRVGGISHHSERFSQQIGGATFLTQHDDEEGMEGPGIDDEQQVVRRSFSYRPVPLLPSKDPTITRSWPRPPQTRPGVSATRLSSDVSKAGNASRARVNREQLLGYRTECRDSQQRTGSSTGTSSISQHLRRPGRQATVATAKRTASVRAIPRKPAPPDGFVRPLRKLQVLPVGAVPTTRAPKAPPSASTMLLMGTTPLFSTTATRTDGGNGHRDPRKASQGASRKTDVAAPAVSVAPRVKLSTQRRKRTTAVAGSSKALPAPKPVPQPSFPSILQHTGGQDLTHRHTVEAKRAKTRPATSN